MKTMYVAVDGKKFENEHDCKVYEKELLKEEISGLNGKVIILDEEYQPVEDWWNMSQDDIFGIYVDSEEAFTKVQELFNEDTIDMPWNTGVFDKMEDNWFIGQHFLYEDDWFCVEEEIERNLCRNKEMMDYFSMED